MVGTCAEVGVAEGGVAVAAVVWLVRVLCGAEDGDGWCGVWWW